MKRLIKKCLIPREDNNFRPHLVRFWGVLLLFIFAIGIFASLNIYRLALRSSDFLASVLPAVLVDLANNNRHTANLPPLTINSKLEDAARQKAKDMIAGSYFAHYSPSGVSPWHWFGETGYRFVYAGENLAINFDDSAAVSAAWMNSPAHRANILNGNFTEIGIAAERGTYQGEETIFVVQLFGRPAASLAPVSGNLVASVSLSPESVLEPISTTTVLGETGRQIFISVKDNNAAAFSEVLPVSVPQVSYSGLTEKLATSPSKLLALAYAIIVLILVLALIFVTHIRHTGRCRHIIYIVFLILAIIALFVFYQYLVRAGGMVPSVP